MSYAVFVTCHAIFLADISASFRTSIRSKLLDLGYDKADFPPYCPEVNLEKEINDKG